MAARRKVGGRVPRAVKSRLRRIAKSLEAMIGGDTETQIPISAAQDKASWAAAPQSTVITSSAPSAFRRRNAAGEGP